MKVTRAKAQQPPREQPRSVGIYVGCAPEAIREARFAIIDILIADVDTVVQIEALTTLRELMPRNTSVTNCTVTGVDEAVRIDREHR